MRKIWYFLINIGIHREDKAKKAVLGGRKTTNIEKVTATSLNFKEKDFVVGI